MIYSAKSSIGPHWYESFSIVSPMPIYWQYCAQKKSSSIIVIAARSVPLLRANRFGLPRSRREFLLSGFKSSEKVGSETKPWSNTASMKRGPA